MARLPDRQRAVQLIGPDELVFTDSKPVAEPGPHQLLCRVEAVGLCFSDLKLLKQFSKHVRKGPVLTGIEQDVLDLIPSYVPGAVPTVPGHEAVVRVVAVGGEAGGFLPGQRFLVQTDYRWLPTPGANAAFGYNFEGALQEYVLMDTRVVTSPEGESMLLAVSENLSASAVAMVEPWACVEDAYASAERRNLKDSGRLLIAADIKPAANALSDLLAGCHKPGQVTWLSRFSPPDDLTGPVLRVSGPADVQDAAYDDVVYFGSDARKVELLFDKVAAGGLVNITLCGGRLDRDVAAMVGRVHYGQIRIVGTTGWRPAASLEYIPQTGEIRAGDKIHVIGAAGPMGVMHVIRSICRGAEGISVVASDLDRARLNNLSRIAAPLAEREGIGFSAYHTASEQVLNSFDYIVLMVPAPELVGRAIHSAARRGVINIFAGIPATVAAKIDLNAYIEKELYFVGTSGSVLEDMKRVLSRLERASLDTNVCVAAVCGLEGAVEGIRAVESREVSGKIVVYPACRGLLLTQLNELQEQIPGLGDAMPDGLWTKQAEEILLAAYQR